MVPLTAVTLVFGGCCANLFFLEKLVQSHDDIGDLITFAQFTAISIEGAIFYAVGKRPFPRARRWILPAVLYFAVNTLNNKVWAFGVSVKMHSIFRSSNAMTVLLLGLAAGKKYTQHQVAAVTIITSAVIVAAVGKPSEGSITGFCILFLASILNAAQSLYSEKMSCSPREMLLMLHLCSLPLFIFTREQIVQQWLQLDDAWGLIGNCLTQWVCSVGVNRLMASGALTTNVVLTVRKFASMLLSAYIFGNFSWTMLLCGCVTFVGAIYYALAPQISDLTPRKSKQNLE